MIDERMPAWPDAPYDENDAAEVIDCLRRLAAAWEARARLMYADLKGNGCVPDAASDCMVCRLLAAIGDLPPLAPPGAGG